ncbi:MAG TPA: PqqD family protein [Solirubrobacteraceae bacterium]
MHLDRDLFVRLNATGRWLWDQLDRPRTIAELSDLMAERYPSAADRAAADVESFVSALAERDLVALA